MTLEARYENGLSFSQEPELNISDLISLRAELDIPVPDPKKDEERRKQQEVSGEKNVMLATFLCFG